MAYEEGAHQIHKESWIPSKMRKLSVSFYMFLLLLVLIICEPSILSSWTAIQTSTTGSGPVPLQRCNCSTCSVNATERDSPRDHDAALVPDWVALGRNNVTERIMERVRRNGTTACHNVTTVSTRMAGLPDGDRPVRIPTDEVFRFKLVSMGDDGKARCAGGDYYEVDLSSDHWKSRPEVTDLDDGTYEVSVLVDGTKPGLYNFTARLLFSNMHGLDHEPQPWTRSGEVAAWVELLAVNGNATARGVIASAMRSCEISDMRSAGAGGGRWTRGAFNRSCTANADDGRWQCLRGKAAKCERPWCEGQVAALESNGWVYSDRRCGYRIWTTDEAWECLSGRWMFMWGDSNMLDYLRNLVLFGLDYPPPPWANVSTWEMNRVVEQPIFINPRRPDQALRVSYFWNGHYLTGGDYLGLDSFHNATYRQKLQQFFNGSSSHPDTIVLNSGLHDGIHFQTVEDFRVAVEMAADFWANILRPLTEGAGKRLRVVLRMTVAPAGLSRWMKSNPQKMEVYNALLLEGFRKRLAGMVVLDAFDATFPFHYDYQCSDGGHYGRPPGVRRWPWFDHNHDYFVDLMLVHMLLTAVCGLPPSASTAPAAS